MVSKDVTRSPCHLPPMKSHQTTDMVTSKPPSNGQSDPATGSGDVGDGLENGSSSQEAASVLSRWPQPATNPGLTRNPLDLTSSAPQESVPRQVGVNRMALSTRSGANLGLSMTASSIVDHGEYFFDDDFSVPFDANLREENNNTEDEAAFDEEDRAGPSSSRSDPNLTSSLLFTSAEGADAGPLWSDEAPGSDGESGSFLSTSGGDAGSDPSPAVASLLRRPLRGEYRLTYADSAQQRRSCDFQTSAATSGTAADSECSSGSHLSTWASLARSNSPRTESTLKTRSGGRMTTWSQVRSSSRESLGAVAEPAEEPAGEPAGRLTTWKQMKQVASSKFVSWRELKEVVRSANDQPALGTSKPEPEPVSPTVQMRGRANLRQSLAEPQISNPRSRSAEEQRNRYSGTLLELFKRTHDYDGGAANAGLTAGASPGQTLLRRSCSISPVRAAAAATTSPAEWFGRLFSDNSLSPVCSFEGWSGGGSRGTTTTAAPTATTGTGKEYRHFGAQFPPALPPGVKLRPRSNSQQQQQQQQKAVSTNQLRRASTGQTTKRITYPNVQALKVPLAAKSKRLVSSAWGTVGGGGSSSQSLMALPDLSFLSRHLTRLKAQEAPPPKLRRSNSCAASVNRAPPTTQGATDSPPDSGINTSADSIPVAYDLIQLDGEPLAPGAGPHFRGRPASSEPDLLTADLASLIGGCHQRKPLKPCLVRPRGSAGDMGTSVTTTASSSSSASSAPGGAVANGEFRAKKSVSFSEKILFHQAGGPGKGQQTTSGRRNRPLSLVENLRVIPHKVGLYGDEELFMAYAPVCSPETSPVKEMGPSLAEASEVDRRYQALVAEVIQAVHRMVAHFTADSPNPAGPPMAALLPPLSTLVCDGLNSGGGRAAGLFAKFRNRLWPVIEESCRQGVSHRVLSEVLREVKALPGITTEKTKFKAFVCACLNAKCLPMWLNAVATNESLLRRHFCEDAFLRQAACTQRELFADLITSLELLLGLPFRLDVAGEAKRATHPPPTPAAAAPVAAPVAAPAAPVGLQPMRARHDIKVKQHQPLHSTQQSAEAGKGRGWRQAFGMASTGSPARVPAAGGPKTRIPVGTSLRSASPPVAVSRPSAKAGEQ